MAHRTGGGTTRGSGRGLLARDSRARPPTAVARDIIDCSFLGRRCLGDTRDGADRIGHHVRHGPHARSLASGLPRIPGVSGQRWARLLENEPLVHRQVAGVRLLRLRVTVELLGVEVDVELRVVVVGVSAEAHHTFKSVRASRRTLQRAHRATLTRRQRAPKSRLGARPVRIVGIRCEVRPGHYGRDAGHEQTKDAPADIRVPSLPQTPTLRCRPLVFLPLGVANQALLLVMSRMASSAQYLEVLGSSRYSRAYVRWCAWRRLLDPQRSHADTSRSLAALTRRQSGPSMYSRYSSVSLGIGVARFWRRPSLTAGVPPAVAATLTVDSLVSRSAATSRKVRPSPLACSTLNTAARCGLQRSFRFVFPTSLSRRRPQSQPPPQTPTQRGPRGGSARIAVSGGTRRGPGRAMQIVRTYGNPRTACPSQRCAARPSRSRLRTRHAGSEPQASSPPSRRTNRRSTTFSSKPSGLHESSSVSEDQYFVASIRIGGAQESCSRRVRAIDHHLLADAPPSRSPDPVESPIRRVLLASHFPNEARPGGGLGALSTLLVPADR
jgi:hypothetical protein